MNEEFNIGSVSEDDELSLLETLDHVLDKGVVTAGEITISVANIDLIYLGLNVVLGSVETINEVVGRRQKALDVPARRAPVPPEETETAAKGVDMEGEGKVISRELLSIPPKPAEPEVISERADTSVETVRSVPNRLPERINIDPHSVEQGLAKLVLTLIELIRRLLEKQGVRRMEGGRLSTEQIEELGLALMKLEEKMRELKDQFGLADEDLNLDLGPVGRLI